METTLEMLKAGKLDRGQKKTPDAGKTSGAQGRVGAFERPASEQTSFHRPAFRYCFVSAKHARCIHYITISAAAFFPESHILIEQPSTPLNAPLPAKFQL